MSIVRGLCQEVDFAVFAVRGVEASEIGHAMKHELRTLGVPLYCGPEWPLKLGGMVLAGLRAVQVSRNFRPTVMHLHTEIPEAAYAVMIALCPDRASVRLARTIHNSVYWRFWPRLGRWCERHMVASHVACVSQDAMSAFTAHRARAGTGKLPEPPRVIYNGVDPPAARAAPSFKRNQPLRVLYAGRLEPEKGADLIPQILAQTRPPPGGAQLTVHGAGRFHSQLAALALRPPPGWTVRLLGVTARLRDRMANFDLVIIPSRFEGLGMVAIEATIQGLPVVATDAPGLRETLPVDYPWLAHADDASSFAATLQRAMAESDRWAGAVSAAKAYATARFDFRKMCLSYARLYRQDAFPR